MSNYHSISSTFLDQINPNVSGLFWITEAELSRELPYFDEINYLFDGLISQFLYGNPDKHKRRSNIFFTKNFNKDLFVIHLETKAFSAVELQTEIKTQFELIQKKDLERKKKILFFDQTGKNWMLELAQTFPDYQFEHISLR